MKKSGITYPYLRNDQTAKVGNRLILPFLLFLFSWISLLPAQTIRATLQFESDSIELGRPVFLRMEVRHPERQPVLFPETADAFLPFELKGKTVEPARIRNGSARDVVRFELISFSLEKTQRISLPYWVIKRRDTLSFSVESGPVYLKEKIRVVTDDLPYLLEREVETLRTPPNYLLLAVFILIGILAGSLLIFILRKPVQNFRKRLRDRKDWRKSRKALHNLKKLRTDPFAFAGALDRIWREYLDPGGSLHLRSLSTTELEKSLASVPDLSPGCANSLTDIARQTDLILYAEKAVGPDQLTGLQKEVERILESVYESRKRSIKSGSA